MARSIFSFFLNATLLAAEAQQVIALRMLRLAGGGAVAEREFRRMFTEKGVAAGQAGRQAAISFASGKSAVSVANAAVVGYRNRVRKNRTRLTKPARKASGKKA